MRLFPVCDRRENSWIFPFPLLERPQVCRADSGAAAPLSPHSSRGTGQPHSSVPLSLWELPDPQPHSSWARGTQCPNWFQCSPNALGCAALHSQGNSSVQSAALQGLALCQMNKNIRQLLNKPLCSSPSNLRICFKGSGSPISCGCLPAYP